MTVKLVLDGKSHITSIGGSGTLVITTEPFSVFYRLGPIDDKGARFTKPVAELDDLSASGPGYDVAISKGEIYYFGKPLRHWIERETYPQRIKDELQALLTS